MGDLRCPHICSFPLLHLTQNATDTCVISVSQEGHPILQQPRPRLQQPVEAEAYRYSEFNATQTASKSICLTIVKRSMWRWQGNVDRPNYLCIGNVPR